MMFKLKAFTTLGLMINPAFSGCVYLFLCTYWGGVKINQGLSQHLTLFCQLGNNS